jgi:hypothetical protein
MNVAVAKSETLLQTALAPFDIVRQAGLVVGFSLLTALSAQVVIPLGPVPITGQTFAVLLAGALLGSRLGAMAMIALSHRRCEWTSLLCRRRRRHRASDGTNLAVI